MKPIEMEAIIFCQRPVVYAFAAWEVRDHKRLNELRHAVRALNIEPTELRDWLSITQRDADVWILNPLVDIRVDVDLSVFEQGDDASYDALDGRSLSDFFTHHFGSKSRQYVAPRLSRLAVTRMCAIGTIARMHIARQSSRLNLPKAANDNRPKQNRAPRCPECGHYMILPAR